MRYPLTFYTDRFVPKGSSACARGFIILIRPKYKDDYGLYIHELTHVKQFFKHGLIIHSLLYQFSKSYRLKCEVEAFKEQARHYPDDRIPRFAKIIATKYGLDVTQDEVFKLLQE